MKIAIPSRGTEIDGHFGHCEYFTIFTVDAQKNITATDKLEPPSGCGCKSQLIPILTEKSITHLIGGNLGQGAYDKLTAAGITVVRGAEGSIEKAAKDWLAGTLTDKPELCKAHEHTCQEGHDHGHDNHQHAHTCTLPQ